MAVYRIYFFGLILHILNEGKGHSSIVWDNEHDACLLFGPDDEVKLKRIQSIEIVATDLEAKPADLDHTFRDNVPSAKKIMGGFLESGASSGTGSDATHLHHVGGTLYAAELYPFKAQHFRRQQEVRPKSCVASLTLMLLNSDEPVTVTVGPVTRPLAPDSCLLLANFDHPNRTHDPEKNPHQRKYSRLTNLSDTAVTIKEHKGDSCPSPVAPVEPCDWVIQVLESERALATSAHTECGNNTWP